MNPTQTLHVLVRLSDLVTCGVRSVIAFNLADILLQRNFLIPVKAAFCSALGKNVLGCWPVALSSHYSIASLFAE